VGTDGQINDARSETRTMTNDKHITATPAEPISKHNTKDGAVAAYVEDVAPGAETVSVQVKASNLLDAINTDLRDSYDSVFLHTNGQRVAVTDHKKPVVDEDYPSIHDFESTVARSEAIEGTDDLTKNMVDRNHIGKALTVFDDSLVTIYIDEYYPIVIENETKAVGVAPKGKPDDLPVDVGRRQV